MMYVVAFEVHVTAFERLASQKANVIRDKTYWAFLNLMDNPLILELRRRRA